MPIESISPYQISVDGRSLLIFELVAAGCSGWSEVEGVTAQDFVDGLAVLAPVLVGADPVSRVVLAQRCAERLKVLGLEPDAEARILASFDTALWDLAAQILGVSCARLRGGEFFSAMDACPVLPPESDIAAWAKEQLAQGMTVTRVAIGKDIQAGLDRVHVLRRHVGAQMRIIVDAEGSLSDADAAIQLGVGLSQADVFWIEDLLGSTDFRSWAQVSKAVAAPVAGGKGLGDLRSVLACLQARSVDILAVDLQIWGPRRVSDLAAIAGLFDVRLAVWPGTSPIWVLAAAHVVASTPNTVPVVPVADTRYAGMLSAGAFVENGFVRLPQEPGLGLSVNEEFIQSHSQGLPEADV